MFVSNALIRLLKVPYWFAALLAETNGSDEIHRGR